MYIYQHTEWPIFTWDTSVINPQLGDLRYKQGRLTGRMLGLGFQLQEQTSMETLVLDVLKSSEIEGDLLNIDQVRSSLARRLGMDIGALTASDREVEGLVHILLDATQNYTELLSAERLFSWHIDLFPTGKSGFTDITVGRWRLDNTGPMQVVSGGYGRERVHFEAPAARSLTTEMAAFLAWFNADTLQDPILKAAIAHLWFITIHPFDDGNGRIARAITDMQLARAENSKQRFYSMSAQIQEERKAYYDILERTQKGSLDISDWVVWFLSCLDNALNRAEQTLDRVLYKAKYWGFLSDKTLNERQTYMLNKLLDGFEGKLNTSKWAKIMKVSTDTALRDIQHLEQQGVLLKQQAGGRSTSYELAQIK